MYFTLILLAVVAIFFAIGKIRSDIVALCALIALLLAGILTPSEALAGFSNHVVIMMAALSMGVSPYPLLFAVAVGASMCFASPFSTPPNAIVMRAGHYTFGDYVRVGLPLQIIIGIVMIFVLPLIFPF